MPQRGYPFKRDEQHLQRNRVRCHKTESAELTEATAHLQATATTRLGRGSLPSRGGDRVADEVASAGSSLGSGPVDGVIVARTGSRSWSRYRKLREGVSPDSLMCIGPSDRSKYVAAISAADSTDEHRSCEGPPRTRRSRSR
jgi:hypothetical protein